MIVSPVLLDRPFYQSEVEAVNPWEQVSKSSLFASALNNAANI